MLALLMPAVAAVLGCLIWLVERGYAGCCVSALLVFARGVLAMAISGEAVMGFVAIPACLVNGPVVIITACWPPQRAASCSSSCAQLFPASSVVPVKLPASRSNWCVWKPAVKRVSSPFCSRLERDWVSSWRATCDASVVMMSLSLLLVLSTGSTAQQLTHLLS